MNKLNTKTGATIAAISFFTWQLVTKFLPLKVNALNYLLSGLFGFTITIYVISVLKEYKTLSMLAYYWSSFCLPIFAAQIIGIDYLTQFVPVNLYIWVLILYFLALPFLLPALVAYNYVVCGTISDEQ
jgi:hypothetical protein